MSQRRGTTLIEVLISIVVLGLLMTVVGNIFIASSQLTADEGERVAVGEEAVRLFGPLDQILRQGKTVLASATINSVDYDSDASTLVFAVPSILAGGSLSTNENDTVVITLDTTVVGNDRLRLIIEPDAISARLAEDQMVVDRVRDHYFRYNEVVLTDATAVNLTVTVERTIRNRAHNQENILYATFRNHP